MSDTKHATPDKHATLDKAAAHPPAAPDSAHGPTPRDGLQSRHGSTGQQQAQQRSDLAQHGVQIHERSRNVDRAGSGKK